MGALDGRSALVTGGDQGIGRGIALRLAQDGADVAIVYRANQDGASQVVEEIRQAGGRTVAVRADVSRTADAERAVGEAVAGLGRLDILVNNAGVNTLAHRVPIDQFPRAEWDRLL
ncbi:MAG: SDR family NAD(P)-dependent oxidoreductase, partial [Gemmatimonadales bacterium]